MFGIVTRSLAGKLWFLFAVLFAGICVVAGTSLFFLDALHTKLEKVAKVETLKIERAGTMTASAFAVARYDRAILLEPDATRSVELQNKRQQRIDLYNETSAAIKDTLYSETNLANLSTANQAWANYLEVSDRVAAIDDPSRTQEAAEILRVEGGPHLYATDDALEEFAQGVKGYVAAAVEDAEATYQAALKIMVATSIVAALSGVLLAYFLIRGILGAVRPLVERAKAIAARDLSGKPLVAKSKDEVGILVESVNEMSAALNTLVSEVRASATEVAAAATEVSASSEELSRGVEEQSGQLRQVSSAVEEMSASISEVADKSTNASKDAMGAGTVAEEGAEVVGNTVKGMQQIDETVNATARAVDSLGDRSQKIGEVVEVINEIAEQTNLLALNAAIEAARAGEHGRGFAVVADEVRKLADRTTKATMEIAESITAIQTETGDAVNRMGEGTEHVRNGVELATQAGTQLQTIVTSSREVARMIQSIAAAAEQQSAASTEISSSVERIAAVAQQTTEAVSQSTQAAGELSQKAERLQELVSGFKL